MSAETSQRNNRNSNNNNDDDTVPLPISSVHPTTTMTIAYGMLSPTDDEEDGDVQFVGIPNNHHHYHDLSSPSPHVQVNNNNSSNNQNTNSANHSFAGCEPLEITQQHRAVQGHSSSASASSYGTAIDEGNGDNNNEDDDDDNDDRIPLTLCGYRLGSAPSLRKIALYLSLWVNVIITATKLYAYIETKSLSVLAALLDSILDLVSQGVLAYTEHHSSKDRSTAFYPAGASRLEAIGVLGIAALMGLASFEVLKDSITVLVKNVPDINLADSKNNMTSFYSMLAIVFVKIGLYFLCKRAANGRTILRNATTSSTTVTIDMEGNSAVQSGTDGGGGGFGTAGGGDTANATAILQMADPTLDALAQDHFNDALSNSVAAIALFCALRNAKLWYLDPIGAILISVYILYSWFAMGKEQIQQLIGKSAPPEFIEELTEIARVFDERILEVDVVRAYHFGPKFLVEMEIVMSKTTLLAESHDVGMELQYEIEAREEVERCFVHIDYEQRPYDEHVVSKVPELREKYRPKAQQSGGRESSV